MAHWFTHPYFLTALVGLPILGILGSWDSRRRRGVLTNFGGSSNVAAARTWVLRVRGLISFLGMTLLGIGAAGPQWGRELASAAPERDLVVVLDCSRSMLAELPSRLERARSALFDLTESLRKVGGFRVALVAFAGRGKLLCPLTHDYDHFRAAVGSVDRQVLESDLAPANENGSGTRIGLGIEVALAALDEHSTDAAGLLLLTDGDDPAKDGEWRRGALQAREFRIRIDTVGLGDPDTPHAIPSGDGTLAFQGREVQSQLEEAPLRAIALETGGTYFPVRTRPVALGDLYLAASAGREAHTNADDALSVYRSQSAWFYGTALVLMTLALMVGNAPVASVRRLA